MMKIAHIVWGLPVGGIETMLVNIANEQAALGHDIHVVAINNIVDPDIVGSFSPKVTIHYIGRKAGSKNPWPVVKLNWLLHRLKPDIIHCHALNMPQWLMHRFVTKSCTTLHTICHDEDLTKVKDNNQIFAISKVVEQDLTSRSGTAPKIVCNGIDSSKIVSKKHWRKVGDRIKIVQVGRLNHLVKGQDTLIEALAIVRKDGFDASLTLIGDGPSRQPLQELASNLGISKYVTFLGNKPQSYIFEHLCDYDIFAQPTRYEGFGLSVAEAMAAKLQIVASNLPAMLEVTDNGKYASIFETGDSQACANAIEAECSCDDATQKLDDALTRVKELFDVAATTRSYLREYEYLLN